MQPVARDFRARESSRSDLSQSSAIVHFAKEPSSLSRNSLKSPIPQNGYSLRKPFHLNI